MAYLLGVDTGGTYTDAAIIDESAQSVVGTAKSLTTRHDLAIGIGGAVDAALAGAGIEADQIALVSLSTTLATNALVEGQGGRVALVSIGFAEKDLDRGGLTEALGRDPLVSLAGGHGHDGREVAPLDEAALLAAVTALKGEVEAFAVVSRFATRNPAHEKRARDLIGRETGRPVTCSYQLSAKLNGPKRALTALLNARLVGSIARLVAACERHLAKLGISVPLMVVRGDGALISAEMVKERPIETILSGPAASIVGARWLTGERDALVSDIGGTTTDVALLRDGLPEIDPEGALVGGFRTMVEAVAMRTTGLGGDSEVHVLSEGLQGGVRLGPRRLMPLSLLAHDRPDMVIEELDRALSSEVALDYAGRFVVPMTGDASGLPPRDAGLLERLTEPMPVQGLLKSRLEGAALDRLVARGLVMLSGVTPSDASHVLGRLTDWNADAARLGLQLMARKRGGSGNRLADGAQTLAHMIVDQLTEQTVDCLLEAAFAEDQGFADHAPATLARHALTRAGLTPHRGIVELTTRIGVPVIGLGASAPNYYRAVGQQLDCRMVLPEHAGVANAIGAVVGQVRQVVSGVVTSAGEGRFTVHLAEGPTVFASRDVALDALQSALSDQASDRARRAGAEHLTLTHSRDIREVEIEGRSMFVEAQITVTATGRPRIAHG
jgi:N-methylhydantoinase A/oxoprolinase/acetone carboxylase beta subunit